MDESVCKTVQQHVPCKHHCIISKNCLSQIVLDRYVCIMTLVVLQRDSSEDSLKGNKMDMPGGMSSSNVSVNIFGCCFVRCI